jgi:hypothetical protein
MVGFDFSGWAPGQAPPEKDGRPVDFDAAASVVLRRTTVLNAHLACLYAAVSRRQSVALQKMVVSPSDLLTPTSLDWDAPGSGMGIGDPRAGALLMARMPSTYAVPSIADWRIFPRVIIVNADTVKDSFQHLQELLTHPADHALSVVELYLRACKACEDHNYSLSAVTAWVAIEKLLYTRWDRYVERNRQRDVDGSQVTFINAERKERLTEGRDFTAAVISEILSLTGEMPFAVYNDMSKVRQVRNRWMHEFHPATRQEAELAVGTAARTLLLVEKIDVEALLAVQLHY